jgi:hypothetical protein
MPGTIDDDQPVSSDPCFDGYLVDLVVGQYGGPQHDRVARQAGRRIPDCQCANNRLN